MGFGGKENGEHMGNDDYYVEKGIHFIEKLRFTNCGREGNAVFSKNRKKNEELIAIERKKALSLQRKIERNNAVKEYPIEYQ